MIIKKIGYLLLVQARIFHLIAKIAPLAIPASFALLYFTLPLKESYQFQEPSLRTKIFDLNSTKLPKRVPFLSLNDRLSFTMIKGRLINECLLVTFPRSLQQSQEVKTIYNTFSASQKPSKNILLLSYGRLADLEDFLQWHYSSNEYTDWSIGIIRAGINFDINREAAIRSSKEKAYFELYSSEAHADLDYFQAVKELLETTQVVWSPCAALHHPGPIKSMKELLMSVSRSGGMRHLFQQLLCELNDVFANKASAHGMMAKHGFQAGSLTFLTNSTSSTVPKIIVSFVYEFAFQQDHLHSSATLYYPLSRQYYLPLLAFLYPGLLFLVATVLILINIFISQVSTPPLELSISQVVLATIAVSEYNQTNSLNLSLVACLGWSLYQILYHRPTCGYDKMTYYELGLVALSSMIGLYHALFLHSLFYLASLTSTLMLLKPLLNKLRIYFLFNTFLSLAISWIVLNARPQLQFIGLVYVFYSSL